MHSREDFEKRRTQTMLMTKKIRIARTRREDY